MAASSKPTTTNYTDGQRIDCPLCHKRTVVKIRHRLEGFKIVETYPECVFCHGRLDQVATVSEQPKKQKLTAFAELLGESSEAVVSLQREREERKTELLSEERRFCRDCLHFIKHPFMSRCGLTNQTKEPMDDCPQFSPLSARNAEN